MKKIPPNAETFSFLPSVPLGMYCLQLQVLHSAAPSHPAALCQLAAFPWSPFWVAGEACHSSFSASRSTSSCCPFQSRDTLAPASSEAAKQGIIQTDYFCILKPRICQYTTVYRVHHYPQFRASEGNLETYHLQVQGGGGGTTVVCKIAHP